MISSFGPGFEPLHLHKTSGILTIQYVGFYFRAMQNFPDIYQTLNLAIAAHEGQVDNSGQPYIYHPIRVALRCENDEERIVALLHDVLEDTNITSEKLKELNYPDKIIRAIEAISRHDEEDYGDFIERCSQNDLARRVKIHDLEDNMDTRRLIQVSQRRIEKYQRAYERLKTFENQ